MTLNKRTERALISVTDNHRRSRITAPSCLSQSKTRNFIHMVNRMMSLPNSVPQLALITVTHNRILRSLDDAPDAPGDTTTKSPLALSFTKVAATGQTKIKSRLWMEL